MGGSIKIWLFVLLLPFFAAIGHDFYVSYLTDPDQKARLEALDIDPSVYQVSDFGYLIVHYLPDFYENTKAAIDETTWAKYIDPVLQQFTFVIGLVPAALFLLYLFIARMIGLPPYRGWRLGRAAPTASNYEGVFKDRDKENKFKYNRR